MPTTSPRVLNSGPPELPGFTATSVWMKGTALSSGRERPLALTTPAVTVFSNPNGDPMASTHSPTLRSLVLPRMTVGRFLASILSTATSVLGSAPSTLAKNSRRSVSFTITSRASRTTCALVRMMPSALTMKPEPCPRVGVSRGVPWPCPGPCWKRRKNSKNGSLPNGSSRWPRPALGWLFDVLLLPVTLMFTTAGPYCAVICEKSGSAIGTLTGLPATRVLPGAVAVAKGVSACAGCMFCSTETLAPPIAPAATRAMTRRALLRVIVCM